MAGSVDFYSYLVDKIRALPVPSASARGALYRALLRAMENFVERTRNEPGMEEVVHFLPRLSDAMTLVEREFDKAIVEEGKRKPDWVASKEPRTTEDAIRDLSASSAPEIKEAVEKPSFPTMMRELTDGNRVLRSVEVDLSALADGPPPLTLLEAIEILRMRTRVCAAVLRRYIHTTAGTERLGYFWTVLEPMIQIVLVVSMYWILGYPTIFGMPTIPFTIIGVSAWLMMRMIMFRIGHGLGREATLCSIPIIKPLDIIIAKSIFYGITYTAVMLVGLFVTEIFNEHKFEIQNLPLFLGYWLVFWLFSVGFGLSYAKFIHSYPWMERTSLFMLRGIYLLSGALFVSEQLPTGMREWIVWIPTVHGIQLMRSAFFWEYESTDASAPYFLISTLLVAAFGLMCERTLYRSGITA